MLPPIAAPGRPPINAATYISQPYFPGSSSPRQTVLIKSTPPARYKATIPTNIKPMFPPNERNNTKNNFCINSGNRFICSYYPCPARVGRDSRRALRRMLIVIHNPALFTTSPIERIHPLFDQTVKGRIWLIAHMLHQAVLNRVIVHVIHMDAKVCLAANEMLPISPLPYAPLVLRARTPERAWMSC